MRSFEEYNSLTFSELWNELVKETKTYKNKKLISFLIAIYNHKAA